MSKDLVRHLRLRAVVAYPVVSAALVAAIVLVVMSFGPAQGLAVAASIPRDITTPTATTTDTPSTTTTTATAPTALVPAPTPSPSPVAATRSGTAPVNHHVLARIEGSHLQANYLPVDEPVPDAAQFQTFRVRFQMHNAGAASITASPRLEYRTEGSGGYAVVPEKPMPGVPVRVAREWVPSLGLGGGTMEGPLGEDIAVADLRLGKDGGLALSGHRSMGANPDGKVTLQSDSYTEEEFTVSLTIDAQYFTGYEFRITDRGTALAGTQAATIRLGAPPAIQLSPGQHQGIDVVGPQPVKAPGVVPAGSAFPAVFAADSTSASPASTSSVAAISPRNSMRYPLVVSSLTSVVDPLDQIHGPFSMTTDKCGICHRTHTAAAPNLLAKRSPTSLGSQSTLCLACHDGTGAKPNVGVQYGLTRPANEASTRQYYSHDAVDATPTTQHTQSQLDEFGTVPNRHSECADCHNPHKATAAATRDSTKNADGWATSGRLAGVSGVSVVNGAADSAPTYTFLSGANDAALEDGPVTNVNPITLEYQLCFKCHSGFTQLPLPIAGKPSKDWLDKGVEFNPANSSFHPVEAAGRNTTAAMKASLAGASSYKLWDFTVGDTIRCLSCHASSDTSGPNPPLVVDSTLPQPGGALVPHTSVNRGILIRNYQDRVLKPFDGANVDYSAGDFALCYVCHGEAPFAPSPDPAAQLQTNFSFHSKHLTGLAGKGSPGTDIDTAGDGGGNAICAECHFRLHSTTNKVGEQTLTGDPVTGSRLVNFAPNVRPEPVSGKISWTSTGEGSGSCTLTCHGHPHTATDSRY